MIVPIADIHEAMARLAGYESYEAQLRDMKRSREAYRWIVAEAARLRDERESR